MHNQTESSASEAYQHSSIILFIFWQVPGQAGSHIFYKRIAPHVSEVLFCAFTK
jgi:hypothetical protein